MVRLEVAERRGNSACKFVAMSCVSSARLW